MRKREKERKEKKKKDKLWKEEVKNRDKECVICGQKDQKGRGKGLNAHHLIPREIKESRHKIWNGITLCTRHHRFSREISAHQNSIAFILWLETNRPEQFKKIKEFLNEKSRKNN